MTSPDSPIVLAAFEGWNDAGSAASEAISMIAQEWGSTPLAALDPEDYYDFQVARPVLSRTGQGASMTWPSTRVSATTTPRGRQLLLIQGIEPSMRWRTYCSELLSIVRGAAPSALVGVGALLADVPHSRPIPVQTTTEDPALAASMNLDSSEYAGPVGIISVLTHTAEQEGIRTLSVWAAVPHYVSQPPSPKATLAVLSALEDVVGEPLPTGELEDLARAWERGVDELAEEDPEVAEYVHQLEEAKDTAELPEASGEAIAQEFERYLRRRDPGSGPGGRGGPGGSGK